jgi:hypothetical protein
MALQQRLSTRSRPAFSGVRVGHAAAARPAVQRSRGVLTVRAMVREWPDKEFIAETLSIFPDEGVANAEQARVSAGCWNWECGGNQGGSGDQAQCVCARARTAARGPG